MSQQWRLGLAGALLAVLLWQVLWQPGLGRLERAQQAHARALVLAGALLGAQPGGLPAQVERSPARLSASARAAGLKVLGFELGEGQLQVAVQGPAQVLLGWLQAREVEGGRFSSLTLERIDGQLRVQAVLEVPAG
ncbi:hypothetical protein DCO48_18250 [Pseudomonas sp. SDI]|uniref:type II secretion system protein GspM n=1 Tax=Pseudomonas sp. SDI TaxID=2170734 RepID=UPI000DE65485|nr:type II secretion system protein GspM [Pseudomonas sp. SDI]PWB31109.1 hypothetical protein DCO48_18250 [Pseudomonas sp. SDI]